MSHMAQLPQRGATDWSTLVRLLLATAVALQGMLLTLAFTSAPASATGFGTEEDCVHDEAVCRPDGFYAVGINAGPGCNWEGTVDWGDGNAETRSYGEGVQAFTHNYSEPGLYTVTFTGGGSPTIPNHSCNTHPFSVLVEVPAPAGAPEDPSQEPPQEPPHEHDDDEQHRIARAVDRTWDRTDRPVREGHVSRTWMWGPWFWSGTESYSQSPGGERHVEYFEKSRMEINDPDGDPEDLWYVTNGLLVVEMVDGRIQLGDNDWDDSVQPAEIPIGGDPVNPDAPTYASIGEWGLRGVPAQEVGSVLTQTVQNGNVVSDDQFAQYGVTAAHRVHVDHIDHTVASVFWDFMNSEGEVYSDGGYHTDQMFVNPFYATGLPITGAFWATIMVGGESTDVLWQCFERRCLTYNPDNDPAWQVEAGNVGQHYYYWRYGHRPWETNLE